MTRRRGRHQRRRSLIPYNTGIRACVAPPAIRIRLHPGRCRQRQQGVRQPRVEVTPEQWHAANISGSECTDPVHTSHGPKWTGHVRPHGLRSTTTSPMDPRRRLIFLAPNSGPVLGAYTPALTSSQASSHTQGAGRLMFPQSSHDSGKRLQNPPVSRSVTAACRGSCQIACLGFFLGA